MIVCPILCLIMKKIIYFSVFVCISACKSINKSPYLHPVFREVWEHYDNPEDSLQRKALLFLVKHIENKQGLAPQVCLEINPVYHHIFQASKSDTFDFEKTYIHERFADIAIADTAIITAEQLIENIDYAFKTRNLPWVKQTSFQDFCEYVLPYRIRKEPLSEWRKFFYEEQKPLIDSLVKAKVYDPKIVCKVLSDKLFEQYHFYSKLNLPVTNLVDLYKNPIGECITRYILFTAMARSIGLPVAIDFTPQYGSFPGNHQWTTLISSTDSVRAYPFNGGEKWKYFPSHGVKMFRFTYSNKPTVDNDSELLSTPTIKDVTTEYPQVVKDLVFPYPINLTQDPIYLFTFSTGTNLVLLAEGKIKDHKITFKDLCYTESSVLLMGHYVGNKVVTIKNPFTIQNWTNAIVWHNPLKSKMKNVRLYRKYPVSWDELPFYEQINGAKIQGSNQPDFSTLEDIYTIEKYPEHIVEFKINSTIKFNYFRYLPANSAEINLAELNFYFGDKKVENQNFITSKGISQNEIEKINDNNIRTNFIAPKSNWVGVDVSKQAIKTLKSIKIMPRNNFNTIEKNHLYELFYFDKDWISLGKKTAVESYIDFGKVPDNCLLLLRNLTEGSQERIFTYKNDSKYVGQIFW